MRANTGSAEVATQVFASTIADALGEGGRLALLFAVPEGGAHRLVAVIARNSELWLLTTRLSGDDQHYPAVTGLVPAADWYEREIHDLYGLEPVGHPDLDPLVLPRPAGVLPPRPASGEAVLPIVPSSAPLTPLVRGEGMFTIPYGPVRSGVFEAIEYVLETPGEDIPRLRTRAHYKHRGVEQAFFGRLPSEGVLLAEHTEGVATVAHATAYCAAIEQLAGIVVPADAGWVRVLHAELERIANHLDSTLRHTEAAGQAVGVSRIGLHKERLQRLRADLCGNRFGRGVVVPGGVARGWPSDADDLVAVVARLESGIRKDLDPLMRTPSFLDRLRGTGKLPVDIARAHGALGPLGRGSGLAEDVRVSRPYGQYRESSPALAVQSAGDALARQLVRCDEIGTSFALVRESLRAIGNRGYLPPPVAVSVPDGHSLGWAEAPQGEVLYYVAVESGRLDRVKARSASFHNLGLFTAAFPGDITTDFAFIEASFGLSIAGVSG